MTGPATREPRLTPSVAGRTGLAAGVARVTITPPTGSPLVGFAGRGPATACHDELTATALVFVGERTRLAIVACDLLGAMSAPLVAEKVAALTDVPASTVVVAASHTHYGPPDDLGRAAGPTASRGPVTQETAAAYMPNLINLLAGAVVTARARARPCRVGGTVGSCRIGVNRRQRLPDGRIILGQNPDGPYDPRVVVVRVDGEDGRPLAAIMNCACHPVSLGGTCTEISADFPGVARDLAERETGATWLFLQGAAGDVNPLLRGWDWTHPRRLGMPLGSEALRLYWSIKPEGGRGPLVTSTTLELPPLLPASRSEAEQQVAALEADAARLGEEDSSERAWVESRLANARRGLRALDGEPLPAIPASVTAACLDGEIGIVTSPGEVFTEIGREIVRGSPFPLTLYAGYSNGVIWYVPTPKAYAEGGYEVTHGCRVGPQAAGILSEGSVRLLQEVRAPTDG